MSVQYKNVIFEDVERIDVSGYSDEDFLDFFVETFRSWVRRTHGEEVKRFPPRPSDSNCPRRGCWNGKDRQWHAAPGLRQRGRGSR